MALRMAYLRLMAFLALPVLFQAGPARALDDPLGSCCFEDGSCLILTSVACSEASGSCGWGYGMGCDPNPCASVTGACCYPSGICLVERRTCCYLRVGTYGGDGSSCDPDPCATMAGACCWENGTCAILAYPDCVAGAGAARCAFLPGQQSCDPNPCPNCCCSRACCLPGGACVVLSDATCWAAGGVPMGGLLACFPNPCPTSDAPADELPAELHSDTWGRLKSRYRG